MAAYLQCDSCSARIDHGFSIIADVRGYGVEKVRINEDYCTECFYDAFEDITEMPDFRNALITKLGQPERGNH